MSTPAEQPDDLMAIADAVGVTRHHPENTAQFIAHPSMRHEFTDQHLTNMLAAWSLATIGMDDSGTSIVHGVCEGCDTPVCYCDHGVCDGLDPNHCTHSRFLCAGCAVDECGECRAEHRDDRRWWQR